MDESIEKPERSKAARNEARKLTATSYNAVGLACLGFGVLTPAFEGDHSLPAALKFALGAAVCYVLH